MIKAVLIDDEMDSIETLSWKLENYCKDVSIIGTFNNPVEGLDFLKNNKLDLLFLDIEMPKLNGFDVLQEIPKIDFDIIFTTAYDDFGIQAIKFSALDYLLKPVQVSELQTAVAKHKKKALENDSSVKKEQIDFLFRNIKLGQEGKPGFIALATRESIEFAQPDDIIACASDSNYTMVHFVDGRKKLISRTLKEFDLMLTDHEFFRPHHSFLVNLAHVREYVRTDGGYLVMTNKMKIPVSKSKREEFLNLLG